MMCKPGLIFFTAFFPVLLFAQPASISFFNHSDSTTVSGKVDGYSATQETQLINYYVYDIMGERTKFSTPIGKDGKFNFSFIQTFEGEFDLQYGANFVKLYAKPGEAVSIKIDHDVADKFYHFPGAYKIEGPSATISTHILKFFAQYLPMIEQRPADMKLSTVAYIELAHRNLQNDLALLNKYIGKNHSPPAFNEWASNYLTYEAAGLILLKPFLDKDKDHLIDGQLNGFLKDIPLQNEKALKNASYYKFLGSWIEGLHMVLGEGRDRAELATGAAEVLKKIDTKLNGINREIAYYDCYAWDASSELATFRLEQVWNKFDSAITDHFVHELLLAKRNELHQEFVPYSVAERIAKFPIDPVAGKNLLSFFEKEKGHFVYVDFWGTWCAPCMADMPHYRSFIQQFAGEPIDFLFLSVRTSLDDSKAVQERFSIPGKFIALNKNETAIVNQVFGFSSYPSSFIIDPDGKLVTKNIRVMNAKDATDLIRILMKKAN